ncbi:RNA-binding domain-containing protein [Linderina pennispora]|uniref:RNA-binding domain-containing protein n=1 Tax=Linderina pennispora TaxID=61395 RepID=A0A1Y1W4C7_9FUNG|nr:RNA-binding domain-containing protein [Linderina pennispora]ORX68420.1 RNA-binding domain-containing protein [Linderina pennispora]
MYAAPQGQAQQVSPANGGASGKSADDPNAKSLYVGNLDPRVTEQGHGGLSYGFDAEASLQALNGRRVYEYEIRVNWAFTGGVQIQEDTSNHFHIFVGDLSSEAFSAFPSMSDARVMWDMTSGKSRGYGFVAFRDRSDADNAISSMNGEWLGSRAIRVNWANQKAAPKSRAEPMHSAQQPLSYDVIVAQTAQYNSTVYVGNLTNYTTQEQLQPLFQPFGFNAAMAITQLNGTMLNGRPIKCSWGKDRTTDPKAAFGAAAAANPAYSYPYAYGLPQQQYGLPGAAGAQQPPPQANNPQGWSNFGYEQYGYYNAASYPQPGQLMPQAAIGVHASAPGSVPSAAHVHQGHEGAY